MRRTAALIVGGGPAGSAAGIALAMAGARPMLIERSAETGDALCGGFLSWRSLETLERLGVAVEGHPVHRLRVFSEQRVAEAPLPARAIGLSRRTLDTTLLDRAARAGAQVERGVAVTQAEVGSVTLADGDVITCDALFLATGKHDCRGLPRPRAEDNPALGLRVRLPAAPALARLVGDAIELHLFEGGYAGLMLQEDGSANLCMAVRKSRLTAAGSPPALLAQLGEASPRLGERLAHADGGALDAIGAVPYGWRATEGVAGLFRLGDQAAVIPSLAGEGMGIALASGEAAARYQLSGQGGAAFQRDLARATARPIRIARLVRDLAERRTPRALAPRLLALAPWLARPIAAATRLDRL